MDLFSNPKVSSALKNLKRGDVFTTPDGRNLLCFDGDPRFFKIVTPSGLGGIFIVTTKFFEILESLEDKPTGVYQSQVIPPETEVALFPNLVLVFEEMCDPIYYFDADNTIFFTSFGTPKTFYFDKNNRRYLICTLQNGKWTFTTETILGIGDTTYVYPINVDNIP